MKLNAAATGRTGLSVRGSIAVAIALLGAFGCAPEEPQAPTGAGIATAPIGAEARVPTPAAGPVPTAKPGAPATGATQSAPPREQAPYSTLDEELDDDVSIEESGPLTEAQRLVFRAVGICLAETKKSDAPTKKSLSVDLTIESSGKVMDVVLGAGYTPEARTCVEKRLRAIAFPADPDGGLRILRYDIDEAP